VSFRTSWEALQDEIRKREEAKARREVEARREAEAAKARDMGEATARNHRATGRRRPTKPFANGQPGTTTTRMNPSQAGRESAHIIGREVSPETIIRWITVGASAGSGARVKLEGTRVGGRWLVTPEALSDFCTELTRARTGSRPATLLEGRACRAVSRLRAKGF